MNSIRMIEWFVRSFCVLSEDDIKKRNLEFVRNVHGDQIMRLNCRSIWKDDKGHLYLCESLKTN